HFIFLDRQVDHDQAIDAGGGHVTGEFRRAIGMDGIVIAHQHDRRGLVALAKLLDHLKHLGHGRAGLQRAHRRGLHGRAVRHGIGEGHAQLDHIGAAGGQLLQNGEAGLHVRIAGGDEGHESGAALLLQAAKSVGKPAHSFSPSFSATEKMSLSPRPDRQTATSSSFFNWPAIFTTCAMAWADSRAGMMPSSLDSSMKASSASWSVTEKYFTRPISFSQLCSGPTPG